MDNHCLENAGMRNLSSGAERSSVKQMKGIWDNCSLSIIQRKLLKVIQREFSDAKRGEVIQARFPSYEALQKLKGDRTPGDIRNRLEILLIDMKADGEIAKDLVVDYKSLIDDEGNVNKILYDELLRVSEEDIMKRQYLNPDLGNAVLNAADQDKVKEFIKAAKESVIDTVIHPELINKVFGSRYFDAFKTYSLIMKRFDTIEEEVFTTDYNGDDDQLGWGGYATFGKEIHLAQTVCKGDENNGKMVLIHEFAHFVNNNVVDLGYLNSPMFRTMEEEQKINNAAHYEVVPGWLGNIPAYSPMEDFIPENPTVAPLTLFVKGQGIANTYLEQAWIVAVNYVSLLRNCYLDKTLMSGHESVLNEVSMTLGLTIHENASDTHVTELDITLMEGIAKKLNLIVTWLPYIEETHIGGASSEQEYFGKIILYLVDLIPSNGRFPISVEMLNYLQGYKGWC